MTAAPFAGFSPFNMPSGGLPYHRTVHFPPRLRADCFGLRARVLCSSNGIRLRCSLPAEVRLDSLLKILPRYGGPIYSPLVINERTRRGSRLLFRTRDMTRHAVLRNGRARLPSSSQCTVVLADAARARTRRHLLRGWRRKIIENNPANASRLPIIQGATHLLRWRNTEVRTKPYMVWSQPRRQPYADSYVKSPIKSIMVGSDIKNYGYLGFAANRLRHQIRAPATSPVHRKGCFERIRQREPERNGCIEEGSLPEMPTLLAS